ncbi:MerR family transcriptional regulator [Megasphaera hominis]|uniref:MerR family transcriptional regulator n=1 Tax=Megasphaera hominis TaxID=159836 RepID=A0ABR6VKA1_9FIRM|nr:MerR family transcriptional regulator [Megasphaera hominis]MBC3537708.1 MerR family transcriptional regulator [Megasphaera hominis]
MSYTIQEVSRMTGIPTTTLRYYDKEGLLPFLERKPSGYRVFHDIDIASLQIVECLKRTGMPIADIRTFSQWVLEGDTTLEKRLEMFQKRREAVQAQIAALQESLDVIDYKCEYYSKAVAKGTEKGMQGKDELPHYGEFVSHAG